MSFMDSMAAHQLSIIEALDGRQVTYHPEVGTPRVIPAMLQSFSELVEGDSVDVVSRQPILSVRTIDIPDIQIGDQFTIAGDSYEVAIVRPDSEGITELFLERLP